MVVQLDHSSLTVRDMDRALEFYQGLLGLEKTWDTHDEPLTPELAEFLTHLTGYPDCRMRIVQLAAGEGHVVELLEYRSPEGRDLQPAPSDVGTGHFAFRVESDLRGLHRRIKERGYLCYSPEPLDIPDGPLKGGLAAFVADADSVTVELLEHPPDVADHEQPSWAPTP